MELIIVVIFVLLGLFAHRQVEARIVQVLSYFKSLDRSTKEGRLLLYELREFFSNSGGSKILPQYKFFTPFCFQARSLQIRHGLSSKSLLKILRPWVVEDLQFEEKVQSLLKNSYVQFFILAAFTWIFYLNAESSLGRVTSWVYFSILQLAGVISFYVTYQWQRTIFFSGLDELFQRALLFKALKNLGLSLSEVLSRTKADQYFEIKDAKVKSCGKQLINLCHTWTKSGSSIDGELDELMGELNFLRQEKCRQFELKLAVLRFVHIIFFYLFGYFLVILGLIRQLALSY